MGAVPGGCDSGRGDTIVAVASPPGGAPRGIVRISGPNAVALVAGIFPLPAGRFAAGRWSAHSGYVAGPSGTQAPARCLIMAAPRSYTREDVVEIHTVGAPPLLAYVAASLVAAGARPAEPGEFTLRAFLNGRLDLTQAEAVCAVINAADEDAHRAAQQVLAGHAGAAIRAVRARLCELRALIEAEMDFPEEEDVVGAADAQVRRVLEDAIRDLQDASGWGPRPDGRVRVVMQGRVNAGKSTLLNALAGRCCALVHHLPGTTLDAVRAVMELGGVRVTLVDTPGTCGGAGVLDAAAQQALESELAAADVVVGVVDLGSADAARAAVALRAEGRAALIIGAKGDLHAGGGLPEGVACAVCAPRGEGLERLRELVAERVSSVTRTGGDPAATGREDALARAMDALRRAAGEIERRELCALEIREAEDGLGEILGEGLDADVLGAIFRRFCIGK